MTPEERIHTLNLLEESRALFLAAIDGLREDQWRWQPAPEKWSISQIAEHIVIAERNLFAIVHRALALPVNATGAAESSHQLDRLHTVLAGREGRVQAPPNSAPRGDLSADAVRDRFEVHRTKLLAFTRETSAPLHHHTCDNPFFGTLSAYHWLIYGPLHTLRHEKQIAEVKSTPGYPA